MGVCSKPLPISDGGILVTWWPTAQGWSPSGRYFGLVGHSDASGLQAQVFDTQLHHWLPALTVDPSGEVTPADSDADVHPLTFCDGDERLAAAVCCRYGGASDRVLVFGVDPPGPVLLVPSIDEYDSWVRSVCWLPGTTSLLVVGDNWLARLDLNPLSLSEPPELQWVHAVVVRGLDLIPGTRTALVLHSTRDPGEDRAHMSLSAYSTAFDPSEHVPVYSEDDVDYRALVPLATRTYREPPAPGNEATLQCSWRAAAVCFGGSHGVEVFRLRQGRPGRRLFTIKQYRSCSWSACGAFLAGKVKPSNVAVVDGRTGAVLVLVAGQSLWHDFAIEDLRIFRITWTATGLLHITTSGHTESSDREQGCLYSVRHSICSFAAAG